MNKKDLLAMPRLLATPSMLRIAKEYPPKKEIVNQWGYKHECVTCRYGVYLRCKIRDGILKVAVFQPGVMCLGGREPIYELYMDKANDKFLTYDTVKKKWRTAKLDRIEWPESYSYGSAPWVSGADNKLILNYLGNRESKNGYSAILSFQRDIREKELQLRHKRETDPWDEELKQIRPLPKDWERWVDKVGNPEQFIYYEYRRGGATTGYCSFCEKDVPIKRPRHNKPGCCPCCRHKITFKALGRTGFLVTENHYVYLMQHADCGFVIREFKIWRRQLRGEHRNPKSCWNEMRRSFYTAQGTPISAYYWGVYKQAELRWIKTGVCGASYYYNMQNGRLFGKTLHDLAKRGLNRTGLMEYVSQKKEIDPEHYLAVLHKVPQLEQIAKAGLPTMVNECLQHSYDYYELLQNASGPLTQMLGINTQELKRLRKCKAGLNFLKWLRFERDTARPISDEVIAWYCRNNIRPDDLHFIWRRMSPAQVCNYMQAQMKKSGMNVREMLTTWKDYLSMAAKFHYNVNDEIVYRVSNLRRRHDALIMKCQSKSRAIRAGELMLRFPQAEEVCKILSKKYNYSDGEYSVVAPGSLEDILKEGDALHHCIASSDRYMERMDRHESYILFLRKASEPEVPYYTMEVEPNGTVRQIRTEYDRQNKDVDQARAFLKDWQAEVSKRLTEDDRKRAQKSRDLRELEFVQMRKDQVTIRNGDLAGRLLVDVLTADLMEAA